MIEKIVVRCSNCAFASAEDAHDTAHDWSLIELRECRRYAPRPIMDKDASGDVLTEWRWPVVSDEHWCGEFSDRRAAEEARRS